MQKLLEKKDVRPYGFPPALWIALGCGETIVTHQERNDPLCRFMLLACSPRNHFDYEEMTTRNGTDWRVNDITLGYRNEIRARREVYDMAVSDELHRMDGYRRRVPETHSRNLATLPEDMRRSQRDAAVERHGLDGAVALANTAIDRGEV